MFSLTFPEGCRTEKQWIASVLFSHFLGVAHDIRFGATESVRIEAQGKSLVLPEVFFSKSGAGWMTSESLPTEPLEWWNVEKDGIHAPVIAPSVPIMYGKGGFTITGNKATLGVDIFGSAFFMLSRYEEAVVTDRDNHDRFPAKASVSYREGFIDRPIVDEYVEILWAAIKLLWPQVERRERAFKVDVSCDVDYPYHPGAISFHRMLRHTIGRAMNVRSLSAFFLPAKNYLGGRAGNFQNDPYYFLVDWIMDVNERVGNAVTFNFIPEKTDATYDDSCPISDPAVTAMLKRIDIRHHEIGLHPGYRCYESLERTRLGLAQLIGVLNQEKILQKIRGGRNHYLRWSVKTPSILDEVGLVYDSTLGYADSTGFRCGTCHEFPMYDILRRKPLNIRQRPLLCMECSVFTYMSYGVTEAAYEKMKKIKDAARKVHGSFTLLWHNSSLADPKTKEMYCEVIK